MIEMFDCVDENDCVLGQESREEVHRKGIYHRAVHIFARSDSGKWILQRRSAEKDTEPLLWTTTCSGHVDAGESYEDAAIREFQEEVGVEVNHLELLELLRLSPCLETGNDFVRVYVNKNIVSPVPNLAEILELEDFSISEINRLVESDKRRFCKSFVHLFSLVSSKLEHFT